jgi:subtilisin family serine protease
MMRKFLIFGLIFFLLIASASAAKSPEYVSGEIIVKLKQNPNSVILNPAGFAETGNSIDGLNSKYKVAKMEKILGRYENNKNNKEALNSFKKHGLDRIFLLKISGNANIDEAVKEFNKNPNVEYAEPNYIFHTALMPNDPSFSNLYGLHNTEQIGGIVDADIDAPEAWDLQTGNNGVLIAVIDSGVDYTHEDLAANIWTNPGEIEGNGIDDDSNGFVDDVRGWDFVNNDNDPFDDFGHGTHVSGTIGAVGNNGIGISGVDWNVKIIPIKFINSNNAGTLSAALNSIVYATLMNVSIMSNSWVGGFSQSLKDTISVANDEGILFIAAAGNSNTNNDVTPVYPAGYDVPNVISVAATDGWDAKASFSSYGVATVHLGAPGVYIYSTVPKGNCSYCSSSGYTYLSGTSMATPHVSGVAGLIKAQFPELTSNEIKAKLLGGVDLISSMQGITITGGRLNAYKALQSNATPTNNTRPVARAGGPYIGKENIPVIFDGSNSFDANNDSLTYRWTFGDGTNGSGVNPSHEYLAGGSYRITLIVNDGKVESAPNLTTAAIIGVNDAPVANAGIDKIVFEGETITFNGTGSYDIDNNITSYIWDFGDGTNASDAVTTHDYSTPGNYTTTLTVTDIFGANGSDTLLVTVKDLRDLIQINLTKHDVKASWNRGNKMGNIEVATSFFVVSGGTDKIVFKEITDETGIWNLGSSQVTVLINSIRYTWNVALDGNNDAVIDFGAHGIVLKQGDVVEVTKLKLVNNQKTSHSLKAQVSVFSVELSSNTVNFNL